MSPHPPELVERVAGALQACWANDDENGWHHMARFCLDLAERAAREAQCQGCTASPAEAVRRAVEGA